MKDDLIQLRDLMIKIISEYDIDKIDVNLGHGTFEISSESNYQYFTQVIDEMGNTEELKVRVGLDTTITIAKDHTKITDDLENVINLLKGDK